jgi:hypothetical protein
MHHSFVLYRKVTCAAHLKGASKVPSAERGRGRPSGPFPTLPYPFRKWFTVAWVTV